MTSSAVQHLLVNLAEAVSSNSNGTWNNDYAQLTSVGAVSVDSVFGRFLSIAPAITSVCVLLSPLPTVQFIYHHKSTRSLSVLPYVTMFVNCFLWAGYGFANMDGTLIAPNIFGICAGIFYTIVFHRYCPKERRNRLYLFYIIAFTFMLVIGAVCIAFKDSTVVGKSSDNNDQSAVSFIFGTVALGFYFVFLLSPFATIVQVIKTKSVESLPFPLGFILFINAILWTMYACLVTLDTAVIISSVGGVVTSSLQLLCHALYGDIAQSLKQLFCGLCLSFSNKGQPKEVKPLRAVLNELRHSIKGELNLPETKGGDIESQPVAAGAFGQVIGAFPAAELAIQDNTSNVESNRAINGPMVQPLTEGDGTLIELLTGTTNHGQELDNDEEKAPEAMIGLVAML